MGRVRAYLAMSLDGFVAGPGDDLSWLEPRTPGAAAVAAPPWADAPGDALDFPDFLAGVGCLVMGRRSYDIVTSFPDWPYGDLPMRVLTHRPLVGARGTVLPEAGPIGGVVERARAVAGDGDVYLDGGSVVREALEAGVLEHLVITLVPTVLGAGIALFAGLPERRELTVERVVRYGEGLVQLHLVP